MKKLFLIIILAVILVSCADNNSESVKETGEAAQEQLPGGEQILDQPSEFEPASVDYGGYNFRILGYDGEATGTWQAAAISEIIAEEETGEPINDAVYRRNREVEALYNIEFGIVPVTYPNRDDFANLFTRATLAGDDLFDAAFLLGMSLPRVLSRHNVTYDLLTLGSLDLERSWWDQNAKRAMSIGGKLSAVIGDVNLYSAFAAVAVFTNKQLMQDFGVDDLYQAVRDGRWTWDYMYGIMQTASRDLNGDGIIDKDDQVGLFMQYQHLYDAFGSAGEFMTPKNERDLPEFAPNMSRVSAIADKLVPIFNDRDTTVESGAVTGFNNAFFDFIMPKFRDGQMMFHINQLMLSFELRSMDADFAILPLPKYDESQAGYGAVLSPWWSTFTVIPITCTDIERTGIILDAMGYYAQQYIMPAYYDVTVTNKLMRDEESIEMMELMFANRQFDLSYFYDWGGINAIITNISSSGNPGTIISQFERNEPRIAAAIQSTLDLLELN